MAKVSSCSAMAGKDKTSQSSCSSTWPTRSSWCKRCMIMMMEPLALSLRRLSKVLSYHSLTAFRLDSERASSGLSASSMMHCAVCTSTDPRDNRLRPSVLVSYQDRRVIVDTTPDFRAQALRARLERVDSVLYTHAHFDHIMGLDDVRPFNLRQKGRVPIYAAPDTMASIQRVFEYMFGDEEQESWVLKLDPRLIDGRSEEHTSELQSL